MSPEEKRAKERLRVSVYRKNNREKCLTLARQSNRLRIINNKSYIKDYLKSHPCLQCGESSVDCLDFHHLSDKKKQISRLKNDASITTLKAEIIKCVILCSNCHRKNHLSTNPRRPNKKESFVRKVKEAGKCSSCGYCECFRSLDFHHTRDKVENVGTMTTKKEYTLSDIQSEIAKCVLLCSNCHRKSHFSNVS